MSDDPKLHNWGGDLNQDLPDIFRSALDNQTGEVSGTRPDPMNLYAAATELLKRRPGAAFSGKLMLAPSKPSKAQITAVVAAAIAASAAAVSLIFAYLATTACHL